MEAAAAEAHVIPIRRAYVYQLEVKAALVRHLFSASDGWSVTVDVDAMERARGGVHAAGKAERAQAAEADLRQLGARIGSHAEYGRADLVAEHPLHGTVVVEVEGVSSRQREQAVYSALGQALLSMRRFDSSVSYAIAVPDEETWRRQLAKIPIEVRRRLNLRALLVSADAVRDEADLRARTG
jgi:hypothetical protein